MARPTKYNPQFIEEIDTYLKEAVPENMDIPTVEGFALKMDLSKKTLYNWGKKHKKFLHALNRLKMTQKQHLIKIGIFGGKEINAPIVSLLLKVNHDMIEKTGLELTGKDGTPLGVVVLPEVNEKSEHNMATASRASDRSS